MLPCIRGSRREWAALATGEERNQTLVGISSEYRPEQRIYSEYRLRGARGGRETVAAIGLRNRWPVAEGVRVDAGAERTSGQTAGSTWAVTSGVELLRPEALHGTARAELRGGPGGTVYTGSTGAIVRFSPTWAGELRTAGSEQPSTGAHTYRLRSALAWRDGVDGRVTLHGRYEYADDLPLAGVISEARHVHLGVLLSALRPAARWTFRQQLAGKWATSTDAVARTTVRAGLAAARGTYEFARWADAGLAYRRLQALGGGASRDGAGAELGISPVRQVRLAVGAISSGSMIPTSRRWTTPRGGCTSISDSSSTRASSG